MGISKQARSRKVNKIISALKEKGKTVSFLNLSDAASVPYATLKNAARPGRNALTLLRRDVVVDDKLRKYLLRYQPRPKNKNAFTKMDIGTSSATPITIRDEEEKSPPTKVTPDDEGTTLTVVDILNTIRREMSTHLAKMDMCFSHIEAISDGNTQRIAALKSFAEDL